MAQPGMAVEGEPQHLPRLTLVPLRAPVEGHDGLDAGVLLVQVGLEGDADLGRGGEQAGEDLEAGVPPGHPRPVPAIGAGRGGRGLSLRVPHLLGRQVHVRLPVQPGEEAEVIATQAVPAGNHGAAPGPAVHPHPDVAARDLVTDKSLTELRLQGLQPGLAAFVDRGGRLGRRGGLGCRALRLRGSPGCGLLPGCGVRRHVPRTVRRRRQWGHPASGTPCPPAGSAAGAGRCPPAAPRAVADSRGRRRRQG